jgi:putative Ca2+/H+ antiporter (TMEM165/GDT1 family)
MLFGKFMLKDFLIPFLTIGIAELGDKTQLAIFYLASNTRKYFQLLSGVVLAFIIADGMAIVFGNFIANLVPIRYIKIISGAVFIVFGILTFAAKKEEESECRLKNPFLSGFGIVLLSEMGDKTQIASGLFATKFNPFMVFLGVITALAVLSLIAIYLGKYLLSKMDKRIVSAIAGVLFILIGVYCFF